MKYFKLEIKLKDCALGEWSEWDQCENKCGQTTTVRRQPINGEYKSWKAFVNGAFGDSTQTKYCPFIRACGIVFDPDPGHKK